MNFQVAKKLTNAENTIHGMFNTAHLIPQPMTMRKSTLMALLAPALLFAGTTDADARKREQDAAMAATREGTVRSLRQIENSIVPSMERRGANYIGAEFDGSSRYRLKFMRESSVIWIDVDGRSGAIIAQAGN